MRLAGKGFYANHMFIRLAGSAQHSMLHFRERGPDDSPNAGWLALGSPEAGLGLDISPSA
ncbi:MAG: hypothetical protein IPO50_10635 [Sphingomonadales bacterium]|nr:hypothetical protein [Sphingomonadales bacterium]